METTPENNLELPPSKSPQRRLAELQLAETIFDLRFEDTLERLMLGHPLTSIVDDLNENSRANISAGHFQRWILKDKARKAQWDEAMEMGSHIVMGEMIRIADGVDNPMEDVARSTLRVKARQIALKAYNRRQFGDDGSSAPSAGAGGVTVNITGVISPYATTATPTIVDNNLTIDM